MDLAKQSPRMGRDHQVESRGHSSLQDFSGTTRGKASSWAQVSKLMGKARAARAIFASLGRNLLGTKPTQRSRIEMEKEISHRHCLKSGLFSWVSQSFPFIA